MSDDIYVRPSTEHNRLKVATKEIGPDNDKTHLPEYLRVDGEGNELDAENPSSVEISVEGAAVGEDNPLAVEALSTIDMLRNLLEVNTEMLNQMKTMNAHFMEWDGDEHGDN